MNKLDIKSLTIGYILGLITLYLLKFSIYFIVIFLLITLYILIKNGKLRGKK